MSDADAQQRAHAIPPARDVGFYAICAAAKHLCRTQVRRRSSDYRDIFDSPVDVYPRRRAAYALMRRPLRHRCIFADACPLLPLILRHFDIFDADILLPDVRPLFRFP